MSYTAVNPHEKEDKRKGAITSTVIHVALIILAMLPLLTFPDPPPGQAGVLVSFGEPDAGETGGDATSTAPPVSEVEPIAEDLPDEPEPDKPKPEKEKPKAVDKPKPVKNPVKDVTTDKNSKELALKKEKERKQKEAERKAAKAKKEAERKAQAERDRIAKEKAAKEAAARAEAERKRQEAEKWKNLGKVPGSGSGGGAGTKPGTQGQPDGDERGEALDGISTGSGVLGGGIAGRKIVAKPSITDRSQNTGTVNVKVCVDSDGNVTSAKYTQSGSTTANATLIQKAVAGAKKYKFDKSDRDSQCGTMKINFRVQ